MFQLWRHFSNERHEDPDPGVNHGIINNFNGFDDIALQKRMKFNIKRLVSSYLFMALDHCQTTEVSKVLSSLSISSSLGNGL